MAVDKSFVVKNGLEVNSDLIVADASIKKVGIASTGPRSTLDVRGGIAATDINITGIATIANLEVADGDVNLGNLNVTGFSTLGGLTVDQLTVTGFTTFADLSYDEITGRNLNLTGIATIPVVVGITSFTDAISSRDVNVSGAATITTANVTTANVTTLAGYPNFSSGATIGIITATNAKVSGSATIATADITTLSNYPNFTGGATVVGTVTAAHFSGGGLGVGIKTTGSVIGYGFTMLNFVGSGNTFAVNGKTVDISIAGGGGGGGGGSANIGIGTTVGDAFPGVAVTAGNLWYNTGLARLFIYYQDEDSAQWIDAAPFNVGIITTLQNVAFSTGTASAPAISFGNDSNSGFYLPVENKPAVTSGGSEVARFNPGGATITGVVTATSFSGSGANLTNIDIEALKDSGGNVKTQANPNGVVVTGILTGSTANFTGVVTASQFIGNGSALTNLPPGLGTALSSDSDSALSKIYFTDKVLGVGSTITIDPPATAMIAYTPFTEIEVTGDADLIVGDGDEFIPNILGIGTTQSLPALGKSGGRVRADNFADAVGTGAPEFTAGLRVAGVCTATSFDGSLNASNLTGTITATALSGTPDITVGSLTAASGSFSGNVTIGGTLTYDDVSSVDSIGIITARSHVSIADSILHTDDTDTAIRFPSADTFTVETGGSERVRIDSSGRALFNQALNKSAGGVSGSLVQVEAVDQTAATRITRNSDSAEGPFLVFSKSRGTSINDNTVVQDDDKLGSIIFAGADGSDHQTDAASIKAEVDGTPGSNDMPTRLVFSTTADGASSVSERLRITAGGGFHFTNGELIEQANITAGKLSDNTNIDLENGMLHLFTTTETTTSTPNIRINSSTSLNSVMAVGEVISVTLITTAASGGYSAQLTIDGNAVTENWTGGSAPSDGGSSGVDIYAYTIIKTASATFTVIATQTKTS